MNQKERFHWRRTTTEVFLLPAQAKCPICGQMVNIVITRLDGDWITPQYESHQVDGNRCDGSQEFMKLIKKGSGVV